LFVSFIDNTKMNHLDEYDISDEETRSTTIAWIQEDFHGKVAFVTADNANRVLVEIAPSPSLESVPDAPVEVERFYLIGWDEEYPLGRFFRDCRVTQRITDHYGNEPENMIKYLVSIGTLHPANVQRVKISSTHKQVEFYLLNHPGYRYVGLEPRVGRAIRRLYGDKVETIGAGGHGDEEDVIEGLGLGSDV
jgi:hypothetical protein